MLFTWDAGEREINRARHKSDRFDGRILFEGRPAVIFPSPQNSEIRFVSTG
jgi:hypothetical protein